MGASQGAQAKAALDTSSFDTNSYPIEFVSESLQLVGNHIDTSGIRGTRSRAHERVREGIEVVQGSIVLEPSPADLDQLLPWILGAAESTDVFALAETLPSLNWLLDKVDDVYLYTNCYVNRAVFVSEEGGPLRLTVDVIGETETAGQTFPAITLSVASNAKPYMHHELALSLGGSARQCKRFECEINNFLVASHNNNQAPHAITPQDRAVILRVNIPSNGNTALHNLAVAGIAGTATYTQGNMSTLFTFGKLQMPPRTPTVGGKTEITHDLELTARTNSTTKELVITHDSTA